MRLICLLLFLSPLGVFAKEAVLKIDGMVCASCEGQVERCLKKAFKPKSIQVSSKDGLARVDFAGEVPAEAEIKKALLEGGAQFKLKKISVN